MNEMDVFFDLVFFRCCHCLMFLWSLLTHYHSCFCPQSCTRTTQVHLAQRCNDALCCDTEKNKKKSVREVKVITMRSWNHSRWRSALTILNRQQSQLSVTVNNTSTLLTCFITLPLRLFVCTIHRAINASALLLALKCFLLNLVLFLSSSFLWMKPQLSVLKGAGFPESLKSKGYIVCLCVVHDQESGQTSGLRGEPGLWGGHQDPCLLQRDWLGPAGAEKSETTL